MQTTTENQESLTVQPVSLREAREILAEKYHDGQHWIIIAQPLAARLLDEIEQRYYQGGKSRDFTKIVADHGGYTFTVAAALKRHMRPYQFTSLLRQVIRVGMDEQDLLRRRLQILALSEAMGAAYELADELFESR